MVEKPNHFEPLLGPFGAYLMTNIELKRYHIPKLLLERGGQLKLTSISAFFDKTVKIAVVGNILWNVMPFFLL